MTSERPAGPGQDGEVDGAMTSERRTGASGARAAEQHAAADETTTSERRTRAAPSRRQLLSTVATVGTGIGLAGCSNFTVDERVEASPVVLPPFAQSALGLPDFRVDERTERLTSGTDTVGATSYLAVHERARETDQPLPTRFGVTDFAARSVGLLAMPSPEAAGGVVDPLVDEPLDETLAGERGRTLLADLGAVGSADFDWVREPRSIDEREVDFLDTEATGRTSLGVVADGDRRTTLLVNLARVPRDEDVVVAAAVLRRRTPAEAIDPGDAVCVDDLCQLPGPAEAALWREYQRAVEVSRVCDEVPVGETIVEVCPRPDDEGETTFDPDNDPVPTFGFGDVRAVQHVEDTVVTVPNRSPGYEADDPPLVRGENTAVVFEVDTIDDLDWMDEPLTVEIYTEDEDARTTFDREGSFELTQSDLRAIVDGEATLSVLHRISNDDENAVPVFDLESDQVRVSPKTGANPVDWDTSGVARAFALPEVVDVEPLKVGFVAIRDAPPGGKDPGDRYGNGEGLPRDFGRTAASATEYLQRVFPGDVVTYVHEDMAVPGKGGFLCVNDCAIDRDLKRAKRELNRVVTDSSYHPSGAGFPDGGTLRTDGLDRSRMVDEISNGGFDVTVAIVPNVATGNPAVDDYFTYWGSDAGGTSSTSSSSAVAIEGTSQGGGDQVPSFSAAHEVGHYFQQTYEGPSGHPMAQRATHGSDATVDGEAIDYHHARHLRSDNDEDGDVDPLGVVSTAYDLVGGFDVVRQYFNPDGSFRLNGPREGTDSVPKLESYMSYTGAYHEGWADARIHRQLIDSGWTFSGSSGGGELRLMVSADGTVDEEGDLRFDEVRAFRGVDEYTDVEDGPVLVELLAPDDGVLAAARVPFAAEFFDVGPVDEDAPEAAADQERTGDESVPSPSFRLPFHEAGVAVRVTHEDREVVLNPVTRSVGDAVGRVPPAGLASEPATVAEEVSEALDGVASPMAEDAYEEAATAMDERVRAVVREHVREYEATLTEPTPGMLTDLVDEMVARLRGLGDGGG